MAKAKALGFRSASSDGSVLGAKRGCWDCVDQHTSGVLLLLLCLAVRPVGLLFRHDGGWGGNDAEAAGHKTSNYFLE